MKSREKKLLALLIAGGAYVVCQLGYSLIYVEWASRYAAERAMREAEVKALTTINGAAQLRAAWARLGERTFSADPGNAPLEVQKQLRGLLEDVKLGIAGSTPMLATGEIKAIKMPGGTKGNSYVSQVPCAITGVGNMETVVHALYSIYRSPRLGRLADVTIKPVKQSDLRSRQKEQFELKATYEALFLGQPTFSGKPMTFKVAETAKLAEVMRLGPVEWPAYARMAEETMFKKYQPPPPPPPPPPPQRRVEPQPKPKPDEPKPPAPPPPPAWKDWALTGVYETQGPDGVAQKATIFDRNQKRSWQVKAGDSLGDGEVVAVEPAGYLVIEVGARQYVIEMGQGRTLSDRVPLEDYRPIKPLVNLDSPASP